MSDEELLCRLQEAVASMGDGSTPSPDAAFYTLGLSSMAAAQFSGLLEQVSHSFSILPDFVYILYFVSFEPPPERTDTQLYQMYSVWFVPP